MKIRTNDFIDKTDNSKFVVTIAPLTSSRLARSAKLAPRVIGEINYRIYGNNYLNSGDTGVEQLHANFPAKMFFCDYESTGDTTERC